MAGILGVGCFVLAVLLVVSRGLPTLDNDQGDGGVPIAAIKGAFAPPLRLKALTGGIVQLSDYQGQRVLINFWATWCAPCVAEMPMLQAFADKHKGEVQVLAINLGEDEATVRKWLEAQEIVLMILMDPSRSSEQAYRLRGQPTSFFLSSEGMIEAVFHGPVSESALEAVLAESY